MEKRSPFSSAIIFLAGVLATTIIGDINGWFLSQRFPLVVHISGFQINIGLVSVFTLLMLVMMTLSFYLGFISPLHLFFHALFKKKEPIPLILRIARIYFFPLELFWKFRYRLTAEKQEPEKSEWAKRVLEQSEQKKEPLQQGKAQ